MTPDSPIPPAPLPTESYVRGRGDRYPLAVVAVAAATVVAWLLSPLLGPLIFPAYFAAVILSAWYGGVGPGLVTTGLSVLAASFFLLEPRFRFSFGPEDLVKLGAFATVGYLMSTLSGRMHAALALADRHARESAALAAELRDTNDVLQDQAAELQEQAAELELQTQTAQETAVELEAQAAESGDLRRELEETNRRLSGILETMAEGVVVTDREATVTFMNPAAARILGVEEVAPGGRPAVEYLPVGPDGAPVPREDRVALRALRSGRTVSGEEQRLRAGQPVVLRYSATPVRGPDGQVEGVVATFDDVTAARQAETERRRNEERFRATFEQAAVGIAHVALDGRWLRVNERLCRIVGYERGELLALRFQDVTHPGDVAADEDLARRVAAGELPTYTLEKRFVRRDGAVVWVSLTVSLAPGGDGEPPYFISVIEDIQARRAAQAAQRESEARFRSLADTAPVLVWTSGPDAARDFVNKPWLDFTGRPMEKELGDGWAEGVHPDDLRRCLAIYLQAFESRREFRTEYRLRRADGEYRWLLDTGVPRFLPDGTFAGYVASAIDITERREAEEQLRLLADAGDVLASSLDYERTLREVVRLAVPVLADYCVLDLLEDGAIRRVAVAHCDPAMAALAERLLEHVPPAAGDGLVAETLRSGEPRVANGITLDMLDHAANDQEHRELLARLGPTAFMAVPLKAAGRVLGSLLFVTTDSGRRYDETEMARAQELARRAALAIENARLYEAAVEANRAKSDFLAVMSHELRTPLNAILGYADLFLLGIPVPLPEPLSPQVERVRAAGRHLLDLIDEILTFARVEAGQEEVALESVTCETLVHDAASLVEPLALERRLEFHARCADPAMELRTDPRKVRQVLVNLLGNAIKFTERGQVSLRARADDGHAVFEVEDTGIGIEAAHLERIFDPFWQVEQSNVRTHGGSGLGLSVGRQLARLLGGDVTARSTPGQGSVFSLRLPLVPRG
jgi:PAS domain S-box-containing protein